MRELRKTLCLLLALLFLCSLMSCGKGKDDTLRVTVLDVGQGDCILLSQGDVHMLIDTGSAAARDDVIGELRALGVKRLDVLVITHPHEDHYGNARVLLELLRPATLVVAKASETDSAYEALLATATKRDVLIKTVEDGWSFSLGDAICTLAHPKAAEADQNNNSLVLRVAFGTQSFLFMADVEDAGAECIIARYGASFVDCDFLKVGHHGSRNGTSDAFLALATPTYAAISVGVGNSYGLPNEETLARLEANGVIAYRTDTDGMLSFICNGREIRYDG